LIAAIVRKPAKVAQKPLGSSKRAPVALKTSAPIVVAKPPEVSVQARLQALAADFERRQNEVLMQALLQATLRIAEQEDDDEMVLLLS
jgi:hypothetical protein